MRHEGLSSSHVRRTMETEPANAAINTAGVDRGGGHQAARGDR
jgi:hypothetical protein